MPRASESRVGRNVRILKGGGMPEFFGQTGTITDIEDGMYRVRLDTPVCIPGVGLVRDDLWEGHFLKTLKD